MKRATRLLLVLGIVFALAGILPAAAVYAAPPGVSTVAQGQPGVPAGATTQNCISNGDSTQTCTFYTPTNAMVGIATYNADGTLAFQPIRYGSNGAPNQADLQSAVQQANQGAAAAQAAQTSTGNSTLDQLINGVSQIAGTANSGAKAITTLLGACAIPAGAAATGGRIIDMPWLTFFAFLLGWPQCLVELIVAAEQIIYMVANALLWGVVSLFTYAVDAFVAHMGTVISNVSGNAIQGAWQMIRDLANIGIIGGLIATAIATILQIQNYSANKFLARLIIAAILVNFSYFFAAAIIDASNYLAVQMYENVVCTDTNDCSSRTIANKFGTLIASEEQSWASTLSGAAGNLLPFGAQPEAQQQNTIGRLVGNTGKLVCLLLTIYVFLSAFALLLGRFVVLIFLLISSPVGVAGLAIPGVSKYAKQWWNALFAQAFFAPVFFILAGFSLRIAQGANAGLQNVQTTVTGLTVPALGGLVAYLIAAAFMLVSLRTATAMSKVGGEYFGDIYKGAQGALGWMPRVYTAGLKFGGAVALRNSIGQAAYRGGQHYRDWVGRNMGKGGLSGLAAKTLTDTWIGKAADRNIQAALTKVGDQKFFGHTGFETEHKAMLARGVELENVKREQEAFEKMYGTLSKKEQKKLRELLEKQKKNPLSADEQKRLVELSDKKRLGGLTEEEERRRAELADKQQKGTITEEEKKELEKLNEKKQKGAITKEEEAELTKLSDKFKQGGLTDDENKELVRLAEKAGSMFHVEEAQKRLEEEIEEGRRKHLKEGDTYIDKDGKEAVYHGKGRDETDEEYAARQMRRNINKEGLEWGKRLKWEEQKDAEGNVKKDEHGRPIYGWTIEQDTDYRQRLETLRGTVTGGTIEKGPDGKERVALTRNSWREADADIKAQGQKMPDGWLKRLYDKSEKKAAQIAPYVSHEEWLNFIKDANVKRSVKDAARKTRFGAWQTGVEKLNQQVKNGEVLEGSSEYANRTLELFNMAKKNIRYADEWTDFMTSSSGEHLRKMQEAWWGSTTGFYDHIRNSGKLSPNEVRIINTMKRPYLDPQRVWVGARMVLGEENEIPPDISDDGFHPTTDAVNWAEKREKAATGIIQNFNDGKHVSLADKEKAEEDLVLARLIKLKQSTGKTIDQLSAAQLAEAVKGTRFADSSFRYGGREHTPKSQDDQRKFLKSLAWGQSDGAVQAIKSFSGGKQVDEHAIMMQDRSMYHPLMAFIDAGKMTDVPPKQDGRFTDKWVDNKLVYATSGEIFRIATNTDLARLFPWPSPERIDAINRRRAERLENINRRRATEGRTEEERRPLSAKEADLESIPYSPEEFEGGGQGGGGSLGTSGGGGNTGGSASAPPPRAVEVPADDVAPPEAHVAEAPPPPAPVETSADRDAEARSAPPERNEVPIADETPPTESVELQEEDQSYVNQMAEELPWVEHTTDFTAADFQTHASSIRRMIGSMSAPALRAFVQQYQSRILTPGFARALDDATIRRLWNAGALTNRQYQYIIDQRRTGTV